MEKEFCFVFVFLRFFLYTWYNYDFTFNLFFTIFLFFYFYYFIIISLFFLKLFFWKKYKISYSWHLKYLTLYTCMLLSGSPFFSSVNEVDNTLHLQAFVHGLLFFLFVNKTNDMSFNIFFYFFIKIFFNIYIYIYIF